MPGVRTDELARRGGVELRRHDAFSRSNATDDVGQPPKTLRLTKERCDAEPQCLEDEGAVIALRQDHDARVLGHLEEGGVSASLDPSGSRSSTTIDGRFAGRTSASSSADTTETLPMPSAASAASRTTPCTTGSGATTNRWIGRASTE